MTKLTHATGYHGFLTRACHQTRLFRGKRAGKIACGWANARVDFDVSAVFETSGSLAVAPASWRAAVLSFHYPQIGRRARKPERPILFCHPELAKDLTAGQPALGHHSPFSKLTAPPDERSVPSTCRLKRTSRSPREILRRLRMTTFGAPFSLLRPICKLVGNGEKSPPLSKRLVSGITQSVSCAHRLVAVEANRPCRSPIRRWRVHNAPRLRRSEFTIIN